MLSKNEWDPLKKIIVGIADDARIPEHDLSLRVVNYADVTNPDRMPVPGVYPEQVINEANQDLEQLCHALRQEGVEVLRPDKNHKPGYYNYCPRDNVFVHDDLILATPQPLRSRHREYLSMDQHFRAYQDHGVRYIEKTVERVDALYNTECFGNPDILALTELAPCFDAANILRANDDIFYLVSNSGNRTGAECLQELLGQHRRVWTIEGVYSYMHIDSTIALLREGLMLLNPARIHSVEQLPPPLRNWDVIWAHDPVDQGHYPGYCNSSIWMNVNLLSISPHLAVLPDLQEPLRRQLEQHGIDCIMLPGRQQRTLGGGFHCVTLDLERDHG